MSVHGLRTWNRTLKAISIHPAGAAVQHVTREVLEPSRPAGRTEFCTQSREPERRAARPGESVVAIRRQDIFIAKRCPGATAALLARAGRFRHSGPRPEGLVGLSPCGG